MVLFINPLGKGLTQEINGDGGSDGLLVKFMSVVYFIGLEKLIGVRSIKYAFHYFINRLNWEPGNFQAQLRSSFGDIP